MKNIAYIDGQNLYLSTTKHPQIPWHIDLSRFRVYLREKYHVTQAYYWLGYIEDKNDGLYDAIQEAGFILKFREHNSALMSTKKGNVDIEIVFEVMHRIYRKSDFDGIVLVSGDGDYKRMVEFLATEGKLAKILFPNAERASSLYNKNIRSRYGVDLSDKDIKAKIAKKKKRAT